MAQYLLSVWHDEPGEYPMPEPEVLQRMHTNVMAFNEELTSTGVWVFGGGLESNDTATVVTSTQGDVSMTDGPYAEAKEQMGGFWIIDVPDLDAALALAAKGAEACEGPVEVRPFQGE